VESWSLLAGGGLLPPLLVEEKRRARPGWLRCKCRCSPRLIARPCPAEGRWWSAATDLLLTAMGSPWQTVGGAHSGSDWRCSSEVKGEQWEAGRGDLDLASHLQPAYRRGKIFALGTVALQRLLHPTGA
jgi:hypothetical protein